MTKENKQLYEIMETFYTIENMLKEKSSVDVSLVSDLHDAMKEINNVLFGCREISINKAIEDTAALLKGELKLYYYLNEVEQWRKLVIDTLQKRSALRNNIDREFFRLMDYVRVMDTDKLIKLTIENIKAIRGSDPKTYQVLENYYTFYKSFWGGLNIDQGDFGVIEQRIHAIKEHQNDFLWLYNRLGDYRSKNVLYGILYNWIYFRENILTEIKEYNFGDYFDLDLIECDENEVFVDIGAFNGDSANSFINTYGNYKRMYCYEITQNSIDKCKNLLAPYDNIIIRNNGVGSKNETMYLYKFGSSGSSNMIRQQGDIPVEMVTIDDDIKETVTFIKMDIEGAEQEALKGCRRHITMEHPKLTICTYHNNEDIWKIPRMIYEMDSNYKYYMRYNGKQIGPTEYVLYAI